MKYFAFRRKKDKKFVAGTDFNYSPPHSIFVDDYRPILLLTISDLHRERMRRQINLKYYDIVMLEVKELKEFMVGE